jgi:hypothetical protein
VLGGIFTKGSIQEHKALTGVPDKTRAARVIRAALEIPDIISAEVGLPLALPAGFKDSSFLALFSNFNRLSSVKFTPSHKAELSRPILNSPA